MDLPEAILKRVLVFQRTEITEHFIYKRLAGNIKSPENARILDQIAAGSDAQAAAKNILRMDYPELEDETLRYLRSTYAR